MSWEDISDILTPEGIDRLKVGQVLMFEYEGSRTDLKIMRITPSGKVWVKQIHTHHPDEVKGEAAIMTELAERDVTVGEVVDKLKEGER